MCSLGGKQRVTQRGQANDRASTHEHRGAAVPDLIHHLLKRRRRDVGAQAPLPVLLPGQVVHVPESLHLAIGGTVILTENDSSDSKITK